MEMRLHANAATTPKTRAYIQSSGTSVAELAGELGVCETTVRRWRKRTSTADRSHTAHKLSISLSGIEERFAVELRTALQLSLDDIVEVMRRCVNLKTVARAAIHRCLVRHGVSKREKAPKDKPGAFDVDQPLGFIHLDLKYLPPLRRQKAYVFVALRPGHAAHVYIEIHRNRRASTARAFLARFLEHFPHRVHAILTDNGSAMDRPLRRRQEEQAERQTLR